MYWHTLFLTLLVFAALGIFAGSAAVPDPPIQLTINNPYSITVDVELKCDYDRSQQGFKHYKRVTIKKKGSVTIMLPKHLKKCQIWPHRR